MRRFDSKASKTSGLELLLRHAMRVPDLLQAADRACKQSDKSTPLLPLISKIRALESALENWFEQSDLPRPTDMTALKTGIGFPCLALLDQQFSPPLDFSSFNVANIYNLYWTCLLLLRLSLLDLKGLPPSPQDPFVLASLADHDLEAGCSACASLLCRSISFLFGEAGGNISRAASIRAPLHFAQLSFRSTGSGQELETVQAAEGEIRSHFNSLHWDSLLPWSFQALIWAIDE